jgi:VanZ family protein
MRTRSTQQARGPLPWDLLFFAYTVVIVLGTTLPWHTMDASLQWWRVDWVPFPSDTLQPGMVLDIAVNIIMYLPFGYAGRQWLERKTEALTLTYIVGMAALLACSTEFIQIFNPARCPSTADVIMNALGAALGAWVVVPTRIENESPAITAQVATRSL